MKKLLITIFVFAVGISAIFFSQNALLNREKEACNFETYNRDPNPSEHILLEEVFWSKSLDKCLMLTRGVYLQGSDWSIAYEEANPDQFIFVEIYTLKPANSAEFILHEAYSHDNLEDYLANPNKHDVWRKDFLSKAEQYR